MNTINCVAAHAAERPEAVALVNSDRAVSYIEFNRDIGKFAAALREFGLPPGSTVAVGCDDLYTHWLLLLAFERLNVVTASFGRGESPAAYRELLAGVDLVLSETHIPIPGAKQHRPITETWVLDTLARGPKDGRPSMQEALRDPMRILRSSGTTGRQKRFVVTRHMYEVRMARFAEPFQFTRTSRYLLAMPFMVDHVYRSATACLRMGGTVVSERLAPGTEVARAIAAHEITHVSLQPHMLKRILDELPRDFAKPTSLVIGTFGSAVSDDLSKRALRHFATDVCDLLGCNEVGGVSYRRVTLRDDFATVWPGIEVEAVDDGGRPVPRGEPGRLRIRSQSVVEGYLDDPEATRRHFRDGWFYPGDVMILDGPHRLKLIGRSHELLNVQGHKRAPSDLEALVMKHANVGDVGICSLANRDGINEVYVAVANVRHNQRELLARITHAFGAMPVGKCYVVILDAIPRNAAGKIQRDLLKEAVAAAVRLQRTELSLRSGT
jgi:acyl-coenzyme A synthetase/AMP-(fatty) acid ligase